MIINKSPQSISTWLIADFTLLAAFHCPETLLLFLAAPSAGMVTQGLFKETSISPSNGSPCVALFNGHENNHKLTSLRNGYVDYEKTSCNGFHVTERHETSHERAVGYGRPRSQSHPKRLHSWSSPASENEDRFNYDRTYIMVGDKDSHLCGTT